MNGALLINLAFWFLLTGDLSLDNTMIGLLGAALASRLPVYRITFRKYALLALKVLKKLPLAFAQALKIMCLPHRYETIMSQPLPPDAGPWECFEETFLVTFTPQSVALGMNRQGELEIHTIERRPKQWTGS